MPRTIEVNSEVRGHTEKRRAGESVMLQEGNMYEESEDDAEEGEGDGG